MAKKNKKDNKNKIVKILKTMIIVLIPLIFLEFIIYSNVKSQNFNYFYDIGSEDDSYLSPIERISEKIINDNINYRELISGLVYFDIPIIKGVNEINLSMKFKDNFPENSKILIGARDQEEWHYKYNLIYDKTIEDLMQKYSYEQKDNLILFKLNQYADNYIINDFLTNPPKVKLATPLEIKIPEFKIEDYQPSELTIDTALRGTQTFYIYNKGNLNIEVWKRDLNMYENKDELNISLYDLDNNLIASKIIKDDREDKKNTDKNNTDEQKGGLNIINLNEGVYKLELENNGDMLITKIKLNQNKIVLKNKVFLAQSGAYFNDFEKASRIYFKIQKPIDLTAKTYHDYALQTIFVNNEELEIKGTGVEYKSELFPSKDFYELVSRKNDLIIQGPEFFSFTEDSWFDPFEGRNIKYKEDLDYLEKNADYVLVDYNPPEKKDGWIIASTKFNINEDNLYIKDDKLNILINTPHLGKNETEDYTIPIDWINIEIHKKGLFEK